MKYYFTHIHYTVRVKRFRKPPPQLLNALAYCERDSADQCTIYLDQKRKIIPGDLAHELVHVLQFICGDRNINFPLEQEHTAYIMHYLMGKILGYSWK